jgi:predicted HAD superfamily phosphohydrolase YqeG
MLYADLTRPAVATDWISTTFQALPRLGTLLRNLRPSFHFQHAGEITESLLQREGIRGVIWDVDGTLMAYHARELAPEFAIGLRSLFSGGRAVHCVLSNCSEERYPELSEIFPEIPILRGYQHGTTFVPRRRLGHTDTHSRNEVEELLRSGARAVRKPDARLVAFAMDVLHVTESREMLIVGDQYFTDVATGNLAGIHSAKVATYRRDTFPLPIRVSQRLENAAYRLLHGMGTT